MVKRLQKRYGLRGMILGGTAIGLMLTGLVFSAQLSTGPALSYVSQPSVAINNGGQILYVSGDLEGDFQNSDGSYGDPRTPQLMLAMSDGTEYILMSEGDVVAGGDSGDMTITGFSRFSDMNDDGVVAVVTEMTDSFQSTTGSSYCFDSNFDYSIYGYYTCTTPGCENTYTCCYNSSYIEEDQALFTVSPTSGPTLLAQQGDTYLDKSFSSIRAEVSVNNLGQVGFVGEYSWDDGDIGVYRYTPGTGVEIMLQRDQTLNGKNVDRVFGTGHVNSKGHTVVFPVLDNCDDDFNTDVVLIKNPGDFVTIASLGDIGPDGEEIIALDDDSGIPGVLNDHDQVLFKMVTDPDEENAKLVLWDETDGMRIVAQGGDPVGTNQIEGISAEFSLNKNGQAAFQAGLVNGYGFDDDPNGIFFFDGDDVEAIALTGDQHNGSQFINFAPSVTVNSIGQVFFLAQFAYTEYGSVYDSDNSDQSDRDYINGLYCWSRGQGMTELIKMGDEVDGKTVSAIDISIPTFGANVSDNGAISFRAVLDGEEADAKVLTRYCPSSCQLQVSSKTTQRTEKGVDVGYKVTVQHNMDMTAKVPTIVTLVDENKKVITEYTHPARHFQQGHWVTMENTLHLPQTVKPGRYELHVSITKMKSNSHRFSTIYIP